MAFLVIFGVGLLLTLVTFVVGELFDLGGGADDGGGFGADASPSPFSSRILFVFLTAFGGFGFIADAMDAEVWLAALSAIVGGVLVAGGTFFLVVLPMARQQGSIHLYRGDLVGLEGEIVTAVPPAGMGRVTLIAPSSGARLVESARSADGEAIPLGTVVRITQAAPGALTVTPSGRNPSGTAT